MPNKQKGFHHYHNRTKDKKERTNKFITFYDKFIYIVVIIAPITNFPQLFKVWLEKDASGVSAASWFFSPEYQSLGYYTE